MSNFDFDLNKLRQNLQYGKEIINQGDRKDGTPVAFMPAGTHIVRIFADPKSDFFDRVNLHQNGKDRTVCRRPGAKCEICEHSFTIRDKLKTLGRENEYKLIPNARLQYKLYMQIVESNVSNDNWKPGETYCVITTKKVGEQLINYVFDLMKADSGMAFMANMFNPTQKARCFEIRFEKGAQGAVNISVHPFREGNPVELKEWYVPLTEVWKVPDTEESYQVLLEHAQMTLTELELENTDLPFDTAPPAHVTETIKAQVVEPPKKSAKAKKDDAKAADAAAPAAAQPACFGGFLLQGDNNQCLNVCEFREACATKTYSAG